MTYLLIIWGIGNVVKGIVDSVSLFMWGYVLEGIISLLGHLLASLAFFLVLSLKKAGVYLYYGVQLLLIVYYAVDGNDVSMIVSILYCFMFALFMLLRKNKKSAWQIIFARQETLENNEEVKESELPVPEEIQEPSIMSLGVDEDEKSINSTDSGFMPLVSDVSNGSTSGSDMESRPKKTHVVTIRFRWIIFIIISLVIIVVSVLVYLSLLNNRYMNNSEGVYDKWKREYVVSQRCSVPQTMKKIERPQGMGGDGESVSNGPSWHAVRATATEPPLNPNGNGYLNYIVVRDGKEKRYLVPEQAQSGFESRKPDAMITYTVNGRERRVSIAERERFLKEHPDAIPWLPARLRHAGESAKGRALREQPDNTATSPKYEIMRKLAQQGYLTYQVDEAGKDKRIIHKEEHFLPEYSNAKVFYITKGERYAIPRYLQGDFLRDNPDAIPWFPFERNVY